MQTTHKRTSGRRSRPSRMVVMVPFWLTMSLVLLCGMVGSVSGITSTASNGKAASGFPLQGISPDPFVEASPLVVGVVCRDGILLLALHSAFSEGNDESSLLLRNNDHEASDDADEKDQAPASLDLPPSYRGPFRIHSLDAVGETAMVCAGWRTDGSLLADYLRSLDRSEKYVFGAQQPPLATALADGASLYLAKSAISEGKRPLSCVGLLASSTSKKQMLWVVDATGAYAVRAHALGRGSQAVNAFLRSREDWTQLDSLQVRDELLQTLWSSETEETTPGDDHNASEKPSIQVPKGSRVEMAIVESSSSSSSQQQRKPMKRVFASTT